MCESAFNTAGERHGMCESAFKTAGERHGMSESVFNTAGERHGMCESAFNTAGERHGMSESVFNTAGERHGMCESADSSSHAAADDRCCTDVSHVLLTANAAAHSCGKFNIAIRRRFWASIGTFGGLVCGRKKQRSCV
jgi:hypothetical protein